MSANWSGGRMSRPCRSNAGPETLRLRDYVEDCVAGGISYITLFRILSGDTIRSQADFTGSPARGMNWGHSELAQRGVHEMKEEERGVDRRKFVAGSVGILGLASRGFGHRSSPNPPESAVQIRICIQDQWDGNMIDGLKFVIEHPGPERGLWGRQGKWIRGC
jgi:hypothetical protein